MGASITGRPGRVFGGGGGGGDYHRIRPDLKTKTNLHTEQVEWPGKEGFMVD